LNILAQIKSFSETRSIQKSIKSSTGLIHFKVTDEYVQEPDILVIDFASIDTNGSLNLTGILFDTILENLHAK